MTHRLKLVSGLIVALLAVSAYAADKKPDVFTIQEIVPQLFDRSSGKLYPLLDKKQKPPSGQGDLVVVVKMLGPNTGFVPRRALRVEVQHTGEAKDTPGVAQEQKVSVLGGTGEGDSAGYRMFVLPVESIYGGVIITAKVTGQATEATKRLVVPFDGTGIQDSAQ